MSHACLDYVPEKSSATIFIESEQEIVSFCQEINPGFFITPVCY